MKITAEMLPTLPEATSEDYRDCSGTFSADQMHAYGLACARAGAEAALAKAEDECFGHGHVSGRST